MKSKCPLCKSIINLNIEEYAEGDTLECPHCNRELLIVAEETGIILEPLEDKDEDTLEDYGYFDQEDE